MYRSTLNRKIRKVNTHLLKPMYQKNPELQTKCPRLPTNFRPFTQCPGSADKGRES